MGADTGLVTYEYVVQWLDRIAGNYNPSDRTSFEIQNARKALSQGIETKEEQDPQKILRCLKNITHLTIAHNLGKNTMISALKKMGAYDAPNSWQISEKDAHRIEMEINKFIKNSSKSYQAPSIQRLATNLSSLLQYERQHDQIEQALERAQVSNRVIQKFNPTMPQKNKWQFWKSDTLTFSVCLLHIDKILKEAEARHEKQARKKVGTKV